MKEEVKKKIVTAPVKIIAVIIALMILMKFGFLLYSFIQDPFPRSSNLPRDAVRHIMTALILLELLILTSQFLIREDIDPNIIMITVLTVLGRDTIVLDFQEVDYRNIFAIGFMFAIAILGLYFLRAKDSG